MKDPNGLKLPDSGTRPKLRAGRRSQMLFTKLGAKFTLRFVTNHPYVLRVKLIILALAPYVCS
jgi:hypothetical protein